MFIAITKNSTFKISKIKYCVDAIAFLTYLSAAIGIGDFKSTIKLVSIMLQNAQNWTELICRF